MLLPIATMNGDAVCEVHLRELRETELKVMSKYVHPRHRYVLVRTVHKGGKTYRFYECIGAGKCDQPDKMEVS